MGDVDGDRRPDVARTVALGHTGSYRLDLRATKLGELSVRFLGDLPDSGLLPVEQVHVIGGSDIDGDRRNEIFAVDGSGASGVAVVVFRLWAGHLVQLTNRHAPALLGIYASIPDTDWFTCDRPLLTLWDLQLRTFKPGVVTSYTLTVDRYRLVASALVRVSEEVRVVRKQPVGTSNDVCVEISFG